MLFPLNAVFIRNETRDRSSAAAHAVTPPPPREFLSVKQSLGPLSYHRTPVLPSQLQPPTLSLGFL